jgi:hypothetical protein
MKIPKTHCLVTLVNKAFSSYAIMGKGADFPNYIHEWAGDGDHLFQILKSMRQIASQPLTIISDNPSHLLFIKLIKLGALLHNGYLGMIKPICIEKLLIKINNYFEKKQIPIQIQKQGPHYIITYENLILNLLSDQELSALIFGRDKPSEHFKQRNPILKSLDPHFPLPLFIWGMDSV